MIETMPKFNLLESWGIIAMLGVFLYLACVIINNVIVSIKDYLRERREQKEIENGS